MRKLIISLKLVVWAGIIFGNCFCKKDQPYQATAHVIGYDVRECACCGGLEIAIDNVNNPNGDGFFLIGKIPPSFKLGDNPKFPVSVKIDYSIDKVRCFGNDVDITRISMQ
jgi:hypothetical protein